MEITFECMLDLRLAAAVAFGLVMFGVRYNRWVADLEAGGHDRGYMGFIVALGCGMTAGGIALALWSLWLLVILLAGFACSGLPMIWGSVRRHVEARAREDERARQAALQAVRDGR